MVDGIKKFLDFLPEDKKEAVVHLTEPEAITLLGKLLDQYVASNGFRTVNITKDIDKFNIYLKRHE